MKLKSISGIVCLVENLEQTIMFYEKLGFTFRKTVPDVSATGYVNWFWIEFLLKRRVVTEAFKEDVAVSPKGAGQYIHINVEDIDEFYKSVLAKDLKPFGAPQDFPWGHREFVLSDPDGYKIVFFSKVINKK